MKRKWLCFVLAVLTVVAMAPFALADGSATLTATGGSFPYDGEPHAVTYKLTHGKAYKNVYFSVDNGETWTKTPPSLTEVGRITVTVRAVKDGGKDPLTVKVVLEVTDGKHTSGGYVTIVNCDVAVNVRAQASSLSKRLGEAPKGKTYTFLGVSGDWYEIQYSPTQTGFIYYKYGKVSSNGGGGGGGGQKPPSGESVGVIVNVNTQVNIRSKPSSSSVCLGFARNGDTFTVLGREGHWVKIEYNDEPAYINEAYIKVSNGGGGGGGGPKPPSHDSVGVIVNVNTRVSIRSRATSSSTRLGFAYNGDTFTVLGQEGRWVKVEYHDEPAYIYDAYIKVSHGGHIEPDVKPVNRKVGYVVNVNYEVNVRSRASSYSRKLGTLKKGTQVTITGYSGNWTEIVYNKGVAYVYSEYISTKKPGADVIGKEATIVNCIAAVTVRARASSSSKKLGLAKKGFTYTVLDVSGNWVKVDYDGEPGFIYKRYVEIG